MSVSVVSGPPTSRPAPSPHDYDEQVADISDRVRAERRARGWNRDDLAAKAGMTMAQVKQMEERGSAPLRNYLAACHAFDMELSDLVSTAWTLPERASRLEPRYVALLRALEQVPTLSAAGLLLGWQQPTVAGRLSELYRLLDVAHLPVGERRLAVLRVARERGFLPPTIQTS